LTRYKLIKDSSILNHNFASCVIRDKKFKIKNVEGRKKKIAKEMFQSLTTILNQSCVLACRGGMVVERLNLNLKRDVVCMGKHISVSQISREDAFVARQDG